MVDHRRTKSPTNHAIGLVVTPGEPFFEATIEYGACALQLFASKPLRRYLRMPREPQHCADCTSTKSPCRAARASVVRIAAWPLLERLAQGQAARGPHLPGGVPSTIALGSRWYCLFPGNSKRVSDSTCHLNRGRSPDVDHLPAHRGVNRAPGNPSKETLYSFRAGPLRFSMWIRGEPLREDPRVAAKNHHRWRGTFGVQLPSPSSKPVDFLAITKMTFYDDAPPH